MQPANKGQRLRGPNQIQPPFRGNLFRRSPFIWLDKLIKLRPADEHVKRVHPFRGETAVTGGRVS